MKTKKMLLYCCAVLMFVACKENPSKEVEKLSDEISTTKEKEAESTNSNEHLVIQDKKGRIKQVEAKYKAFKFKNTKAIFKVDEDYLLLDIPISDVKLEIEEVKNISSNNVNAILVWLTSPNKNTRNIGREVKGLLQKSYTISELKLNKEKLKADKKLDVYIWNNETLTKKKVDYFKDKVENDNIYGDFDCEEDDGFVPDEECGDILPGG